MESKVSPAFYIHRIHTWFRDEVFVRLFKNAGILLCGNVVNSLLSIASLAFTARVLGPESFGILVLIQTYAAVVNGLFNFQSWQVLIKYGAETLEHNQKEDYKRLIKFGILLDWSTAVVATIVAISAAYFVGHWKSWDERIVQMVMLYSFTILFNLSGTPTAILRLFDRFITFATQKILASVFKLVMVAIAYFTGAGLWTFILIYMAVEIFSNLFLLSMAWWTMRLKGYKQVLKASLRGLTSRHKGLWSFVWTTNLTASVKMAARELDIIIVGGVLGSAAVGFYKVAKQLSKVLGRLSDPLYQSIYPELAKLWVKVEIVEFKRLMIRSSMIVGSVSLLIWGAVLLFGREIIEIVFSKAYLTTYPILIWYMLGIVVAVWVFPLQPAMLAMGRPKFSFWAHLGSTTIYLVLLSFLSVWYGAVGAAIACPIYYIFWSCLMISFERAIISNMRKS